MKVIGYNKSYPSQFIGEHSEISILFLLVSSLQTPRASPWKTIRLNMKVQLFRFLKAIKRKGLFPEEGVQLKYYYLPHPEAVGSIVLMAVGQKQQRNIARLSTTSTSTSSTFYDGLERQGSSYRALEDTHKSYIDHYTTYVDDLDLFINSIVVPNSTVPIYGLAHSMGANITSMYLAMKTLLLKSSFIVPNA